MGRFVWIPFLVLFSISLHFISEGFGSFISFFCLWDRFFCIITWKVWVWVWVWAGLGLEQVGLGWAGLWKNNGVFKSSLLDGFAFIINYIQSCTGQSETTYILIIRLKSWVWVDHLKYHYTLHLQFLLLLLSPYTHFKVPVTCLCFLSFTVCWLSYVIFYMRVVLCSVAGAYMHLC